ncbi:Putative Flagellin, Flp1-like, domain [Paenibacillus uliginis N3/975]|uniref:Putative Flagellin, Flp1-like, domain n=1 Tax=Paenibacillus uliginis N3/975 TaxID=1313296 RepID=A0A1X7GSH5_9BACL|nr:Putative Flagellin, Flp1-like, domain [Paenibacillus uliginis N3/975]
MIRMLSVLRNQVRAFWKDEKGIGTLEMILIIVVILIIALIFKDQLKDLVTRLFNNVNTRSDEFINSK